MALFPHLAIHAPWKLDEQVPLLIGEHIIFGIHCIDEIATRGFKKMETTPSRLATDSEQ